MIELATDINLWDMHIYDTIEQLGKDPCAYRNDDGYQIYQVNNITEEQASRVAANVRTTLGEFFTTDDVVESDSYSRLDPGTVRFFITRANAVIGVTVLLSEDEYGSRIDEILSRLNKALMGNLNNPKDSDWDGGCFEICGKKYQMTSCELTIVQN